MAERTFEEIAAALYAGAPDTFVSTRKAEAAEAADPEVGKRILALRKPSLAAWVVNVFAQERAGQLAEALQLAAELREAQDDLDAATLASLGRERRALTRRLAEAAGELAASRGERVTTATLEAVERSISAAFFDPAAAAAVASGRLVRAIEPSASAEDIRDAVAGDVEALEDRPQRPPDELQARRARKDAERALSLAQKDLVSAERALSKSDEALRGLQARIAELSTRAADLEAELARVRVDAATAEKGLFEAEKRRADAAEEARAAGEVVGAAQRALDAL